MFVECMPLFCSHNRRKAIVFDTEGLVIMSEHALISSNEINASLLGILCRCMDLAVYAMIILQRATMFNICENLHNQLHKYHTQMFWKFAKVWWCEKEKKTKGFPNFPAWHCGVKLLLNFLPAVETLSELVTTLDHKTILLP